MTQYAPSRADDYLAYLANEWESVPEIIEEWPNLDALGREVITLDWAVPEDRLAQLRRWAGEGLLTPDQMQRYRRLLKLVEQYRPALDRLFEEEEPVQQRKAA